MARRSAPPGDQVEASDKASAALAEFTPARFPCPKCGKETKEHALSPLKVLLSRICSSPACRTVTAAKDFGPAIEGPKKAGCPKCGGVMKLHHMQEDGSVPSICTKCKYVGHPLIATP